MRRAPMWLPPVVGPITDQEQERRERVMQSRRTGPPALGIECTRCKLELELEHVPYLAHETDLGRLRRALLSSRQRVGAFLAFHRGPDHAIELYPATQRSLGVLASQILEQTHRRSR